MECMRNQLFVVPKTTATRHTDRQWCDDSFACAIVCNIFCFVCPPPIPNIFYAFFVPCSPSPFCHIFFLFSLSFSAPLKIVCYMRNLDDKQMERMKRIKHPCNWFTLVVQLLVPFCLIVLRLVPSFQWNKIRREYELLSRVIIWIQLHCISVQHVPTTCTMITLFGYCHNFRYTIGSMFIFFYYFFSFRLSGTTTSFPHWTDSDW